MAERQAIQLLHQTPGTTNPHMTWATFRHLYTHRHRLRYCLDLSRIEMTVRMPSSFAASP